VGGGGRDRFWQTLMFRVNLRPVDTPERTPRARSGFVCKRNGSFPLLLGAVGQGLDRNVCMMLPEGARFHRNPFQNRSTRHDGRGPSASCAKDRRCLALLIAYGERTSGLCTRVCRTGDQVFHRRDRKSWAVWASRRNGHVGFPRDRAGTAAAGNRAHRAKHDCGWRRQPSNLPEDDAFPLGSAPGRSPGRLDPLGYISGNRINHKRKPSGFKTNRALGGERFGAPVPKPGKELHGKAPSAGTTTGAD